MYGRQQLKKEFCIIKHICNQQCTIKTAAIFKTVTLKDSQLSATTSENELGQ